MDCAQCRLKPSPTCGAMFDRKNVSSIASCAQGCQRRARAGSRTEDNAPGRISRPRRGPCDGRWQRQSVPQPCIRARGCDLHVSAVIPAPEVVLQARAERRWHLLVLGELRVRAVTRGRTGRPRERRARNVLCGLQIPLRQPRPGTAVARLYVPMPGAAAACRTPRRTPSARGCLRWGLSRTRAR